MFAANFFLWSIYMAKKKKTATKKKVVAKKTGKTVRSTAARAADRARVSKQGPELAYVAKKFDVSKEVVIKAIAKVGNMRTAVYAALTTFKARSKAADRAKVSRQPHEVAYMAKKFNTSKEAVLDVLAKHGSSRKKVEAALGGK
jgi:predicted DNA-binding protein YlxM (UPF0122 family)